MNFLRNDSFVDPKNAIANLGDSIQALAIDSIYEQIGISKSDVRYIQRDFACAYNGDPLSLILYTEYVKDRVSCRMRLSPKINVKTLVSAVFYDNFDVLNEAFPDCLNMIKKWAPVGARDERSLNILQANGIESYLTGCFTICFPRRTVSPKNFKAFLVDIPNELISHIPKHILDCSERLSHAVPIEKYPVDEGEDARLENLAKNILTRYRDEASLVITGRLHAAIPCLAMGIPVIFATNNLDFRFEWIDKIIYPYQFDEYHLIDWNPSPVDVEDVKYHFLQYFFKALHGQDYRSELQWLHSYYMDRERVETYRYFKSLIRALQGKYPHKDSFNYVIWGAGFHCEYAYELISEIFPNANLVAVIDKYKQGFYKNVPIIQAKKLAEFKFDHMFITTQKGKNDALAWLAENSPQTEYTYIMSQQKS